MLYACSYERGHQNRVPICSEQVAESADKIHARQPARAGESRRSLCRRPYPRHLQERSGNQSLIPDLKQALGHRFFANGQEPFSSHETGIQIYRNLNLLAAVICR
jgi:hypothetical protein